MKRNIYILLFLLTGLTGCHFLDHEPDSRTVIDTKKKVRLFLVDAYDAPNYGPICEFSSDNIIDNNTPDAVGVSLHKNPFDLWYNQVFAWQDVTQGEGQDSPGYIWEKCYHNIAVANKALEAIKDLEAQGENMNAEKAEALLCRAYNHFILVSVFCHAYRDANLSEQDLGIAYLTESGEISKVYDRGTVAGVYAQIDADLQTALPLVSDEYYSVPKYHFNTKAAYAFAARFYLYKRDYNKVITYANKVLGSSPAEAAAQMFDADNCIRLGNIEREMYAWYDIKSPANLLLQTTMSFALYCFTPDYCRYSFNREPRDRTVMGPGPNWDDRFPGVNVWRYNANYGGFLSKMYEPFEYTNKEAGIGYPHSLRREFTTGETLLCRAEAEIMLGNLAAAVSDMDVWSKGYLCTKDLTDNNIKNFFRTGKSEQLVPTLHNTDMCPSWTISDDKIPYIWCVLHFRRLETLHDGMRWFDIKRYGIELTHEIGNPVKTKHLVWNDDRKAIQLPATVISNDVKQTPNPRVNVGDHVAINDETGSSSLNILELYQKYLPFIAGLTITPDNENGKLQ